MSTEEIKPVSDRQKYERGDVLVKVEVDCRVCAQPLPGGHVATEGKQIVKIRKSELASVLALVEPEPAEIEAARKRHNVLLNKFIEDGLQGLNADSEAMAQRRRKLEAEYAGSVEATFVRDMGRSILPLRSATVIEDNIPAPVDEASVDQSTMLASIVAREVAKVLQSQNQPKKQ